MTMITTTHPLKVRVTENVETEQGRFHFYEVLCGDTQLWSDFWDPDLPRDEAVRITLARALAQGAKDEAWLARRRVEGSA